ncbi:hypothetical protein HK102_008267, partial [Quaeritorhiza haematococci]
MLQLSLLTSIHLPATLFPTLFQTIQNLLEDAHNYVGDDDDDDDDDGLVGGAGSGGGGVEERILIFLEILGVVAV